MSSKVACVDFSIGAHVHGSQLQVTMEGWQGGVFRAPDNGPAGSRHFPVNISRTKVTEKLGLRGPMWLQLAPGKHVALLTQRDWVVKWVVPLNAIKR